jgi:hypothetical protein
VRTPIDTERCSSGATARPADLSTKRWKAREPSQMPPQPVH